MVLHPEFVDGEHAFYTRPMDGFIDAGDGKGIGFGLAKDITHAVIDEEKIIDERVYHTIAECKNGVVATPIKNSERMAPFRPWGERHCGWPPLCGIRFYDRH